MWTPDGWPLAQPTLLVLGVLGAAAALSARRLGAAAPWLALLVLTQAATLALVRAGTALAYQHLQLPEETAGRLLALAVALAGLAVLAASRRELRWLRRWLVTELPGWRSPVFVTVAVLTSATLSPRPVTWVFEFVAASFLQLIALVIVLRLAAAAPQEVLARVDQVASRPAGTPWGAAAFTTIVAAVLALVVYEGHPHVPDEVVYLLQARYLAEGLLWLPAPPVPEAFDIHLMYLDGARWFSPVPPGWPFALAVGAWLGVPWLVNPVLGGLNVLLAWFVVRETHGERLARGVAWLLALSPWHLFLSMSLMTHQVTLTAALLGAWGVAVARRTGGTGPTFWGGLALGIVGLVRPLEGVIAAVLLGLWALGARGRWWRLGPAAALTIGTIITGALSFPYNRTLTGSATRFPIMMYTDRYYAPQANALGFGANRGLGWGGFDPFPGHGPLDAIINANLNLFATNVELTGWAIGCMALIGVALLSRRLVRADWWMVAVIVGVAGVHTFYWYSGGPDFAARYWFLIIVPVTVLVARGVAAVAASLPTAAGPMSRARVHLGVAALAAASLWVFVPWRAVDKYHHFRGMRGDARAIAREAGITGRDLVYVQGNRHPDYMSAASFNPLDLASDEPVYVWDAGPDVRASVARAFPERRVWVMQGPTVSGTGYRVVQGPLPPGSLPAGEFTPADKASAQR